MAEFIDHLSSSPTEGKGDFHGGPDFPTPPRPSPRKRDLRQYRILSSFLKRYSKKHDLLSKALKDHNDGRAIFGSEMHPTEIRLVEAREAAIREKQRCDQADQQCAHRISKAEKDAHAKDRVLEKAKIELSTGALAYQASVVGDLRARHREMLDGPSHGRPVSTTQLRALELRIKKLENGEHFAEFVMRRHKSGTLTPVELDLEQRQRAVLVAMKASRASNNTLSQLKGDRKITWKAHNGRCDVARKGLEQAGTALHQFVLDLLREQLDKVLREMGLSESEAHRQFPPSENKKRHSPPPSSAPKTVVGRYCLLSNSMLVDQAGPDVLQHIKHALRKAVKAKATEANGGAPSVDQPMAESQPASSSLKPLPIEKVHVEEVTLEEKNDDGDYVQQEEEEEEEEDYGGDDDDDRFMEHLSASKCPRTCPLSPIILTEEELDRRIEEKFSHLRRVFNDTFPDEDMAYTGREDWRERFDHVDTCLDQEHERLREVYKDVFPELNGPQRKAFAETFVRINDADQKKERQRIGKQRREKKKRLKEIAPSSYDDDLSDDDSDLSETSSSSDDDDEDPYRDADDRSLCSYLGDSDCEGKLILPKDVSLDGWAENPLPPHRKNPASLRQEEGDPNSGRVLDEIEDTAGPPGAPEMERYDGLVLGHMCRVCMRIVNPDHPDCLCRDYRGLLRSQCTDGLFFATLRLYNAYVVLRRNERRVRSAEHKRMWRLHRSLQKDLLLFGHPVLRKQPEFAGDPRVGEHVHAFLRFVMANCHKLGTSSCVVCGDFLCENRAYNFCNTCKAWKPFKELWTLVQTELANFDKAGSGKRRRLSYASSRRRKREMIERRLSPSVWCSADDYTQTPGKSMKRPRISMVTGKRLPRKRLLAVKRPKASLEKSSDGPRFDSTSDDEAPPPVGGGGGGGGAVEEQEEEEEEEKPDTYFPLPSAPEYLQQQQPLDSAADLEERRLDYAILKSLEDSNPEVAQNQIQENFFTFAEFESEQYGEAWDDWETLIGREI